MGLAIRVRDAVSREVPGFVRNRQRRVMVLLLGIMALSIADLAVTLTHLQTTGMMEANPIAAYLIKYSQSPWTLAAFKLSSVSICILLLFKLRSHWEGEAAAWLAVMILAGMSVMWHVYSKEYDDPATLTVAQFDNSTQWLRLD